MPRLEMLQESGDCKVKLVPGCEKSPRDSSSFDAYVFDDVYTSYIQSFLSYPRPLHILGNTHIFPIEIFRLIFNNDICDFYKIGDYIVKCTPSQGQNEIMPRAQE